jgi:hypothetical protein
MVVDDNVKVGKNNMKDAASLALTFLLTDPEGIFYWLPPLCMCITVCMSVSVCVQSMFLSECVCLCVCMYVCLCLCLS